MKPQQDMVPFVTLAVICVILSIVGTLVYFGNVISEEERIECEGKGGKRLKPGICISNKVLVE